MGLFLRLLTCVFFTGFLLYLYIHQLNELTELRLSIPRLQKEVQEIHEKNMELQYAIDSFESPIHLMELARRPEFGHLKYPPQNEIIFLHTQ